MAGAPSRMALVQRPRRSNQQVLVLALLALASVFAGLGFVPALRPAASSLSEGFAGVAAPSHRLRAIARHAEKEAEESESDIDVLEEDEEDDLVPVEDEDDLTRTYGHDETPPPAWFENRRIDVHKVNMHIFNQFAKPKKFFPHNLKPGDTVRVYYMDPQVAEDFDPKKQRETSFTGIIMDFRGDYQARNFRLRAMEGKGINVVGVEMSIPIHSPMVTRIEVLKRGYIGNNKNAFFVRALLGKKNAIPEDKERAKIDELYRQYEEEGKMELIPEPEYPAQEWDRYPLPVWKQDEDDWDESEYDPSKVDTRTEYEKRIIGAWRKKPPFGKYSSQKRKPN